MTDPPMVGAIGAAVARRFGAPLVVVSQDVFPEIAVELGRLTNPLAVALLRRASSASICARADRVVAIGDTMQRAARCEGRAARADRGDPELGRHRRIRPQPRDNEWARENGLAARFVVMHSGNVGHAQNLDTLVRAATFLRDLERPDVAIVGFGARHARAVRARGDARGDKVRFLPYQPRELLSAVAVERRTSTSSVSPAGSRVRRPEPSLRHLGRWSAGDRCGRAGQRDGAVVRVGCGVVVEPGDPRALATQIRRVYAGEVDLAGLGAAGRAWIVQHRGRREAIERYRDLLERLVQHR